MRHTLPIVALHVFLAAASAPSRADPPLIQYHHPAPYHIEQSIEVRNEDVSALGLLELNIPIPLDAPNQKIENIRITGDDAYPLADMHGLGELTRVLYPAPRRHTPGQSRKLSIAYDLTCSEITSDRVRLLRRRSCHRSRR